MHTSWYVMSNGVRFPTNGLVVQEAEGVVLVDTAWGVEPTQALVTWIDTELKQPIVRAIATHYHDDSLGGWPVLAARKVPLVAGDQTLALSEDKHITQPLDSALRGLKAGESRTVGTLEVFHPGHGHSADNLVVWLPTQQLLFGGCAVKSMQAVDMGYLGDADLDAWTQSIRAMQRRYPQVRTVVPGHQSPGDMNLLSYTLELIAAEQAKHSG